MKNRVIKLFCCITALLLALTACSKRPSDSDSAPSMAEAPMSEEEVSPEAGDSSFEAVTSHIDFSIPSTLIITRPSMDITMSGENYYITGCSDPALPLLLDSEEVADRGISGSFGVYVELEPGDNTFTFTQGDETQTAVITRDDSIYSTTDILTEPRPSYDLATRSGAEYTLSCVAPSGATVTAEIGGTSIPLEQRAATAAEGVAATFRAAYLPEGIAGTQELGPVTYTLEWQGATKDYVSPGSLFVVEAGAALVVEAIDVSSTVFAEESSESDYYAVLGGGARDIVTETGADMYRLDMGGWVYKNAVRPVTGMNEISHIVANTDYEVQPELEILTLKGPGATPYLLEVDEGSLELTFLHTVGLPELSLSGSGLFSGVMAKEVEGNLILTFELKETGGLWGWLVDYEEGEIKVTFKKPPVLTENGLPLEGITIMLDSGHGGDDEGASGIARENGPVEKDINLATAIAVKKYLSASGATVLMTRETDERANKNPRLAMIQQQDIDVMVSLHCNSIPYNSDGIGPSGTEVFYYHASSKALAQSLADEICLRTGRKNRGPKNANYWITLSTNVPSVLVEMGFLTNPAEYDKLCDPAIIYDTAAAIEAGILGFLAGTDDEAATDSLATG